jgi:hypothetical protein
MSASLGTNISSFIIRFVDATRLTHEARSTYRGVIRHIQSGDELSFTRWAEATDFIQRFFPIEDLDPRSVSDA